MRFTILFNDTTERYYRIMRGFFERMNWKMQRTMQGRNGQDRLAMHCNVLTWIFLLIGLFSGEGVFTTIALIFLVYGIFRTFSKNVSKRQAELAAYERVIAKPGAFFSLQKKRFQDRKTHKYLKCACGQVLRVPKGKGKIKVTCPKCHTQKVCKT